MQKKTFVIENITEKFLNIIKSPDSKCSKLNYLIVMPSQADMRSQYYFPIGLGIVSSSLKASGRTVLALNLTYKKNPLDLLKKTIIDNDINVIATGGLSGEYVVLREIIDAAKSIKPDIVIIVGGGIITAEPNVAMEAFENADFGIIGEGEVTINALAYALETDGDISRIEGVIIKRGAELITTSPREEIMDLDCLPFPDYDGFDFEESFKRQYSSTDLMSDIGISMILSRSCPYSCTFCFHSSGKKYRSRTLDNVFKEIEWLKSKYEFKHILINDELFGGDLEYTVNFCKRIKPYKTNYFVQTRLDKVSDEMLNSLIESGCTKIYLGVEHINETVLKSMRKQTSVKMVESVYNKVLEKGLVPIGNIIFGDLEETAETVREALDWWRKNPSFNIRLIFMKVFPGSHIYKISCERGIIKNPIQYLRDGCPMINITRMTDNEWGLMKDEIAMQRILYENSIFSSDISKIPAMLDSLISKYKCGVWPVKMDVLRFYKKMSDDFYNKAYFININPNSLALRDNDGVYSRKIYEPDIILSEDIEIIFCPIMGLFEEISSICKINYPSVKKVGNVSSILQWWQSEMEEL